MPEPKKNREDYINKDILLETPEQDKVYDPTAKHISEHLEEIRQRLFITLGFGLLMFIISFNYSELLISLLENCAPKGSSFFQLKPGELLFSTLKVSGFSGLIISSPVICWQLFSFIEPGLKVKERKILRIIFVGIPVLLLAGVLFAYYFILPPLLSFLLGFNSSVIESRYGIEHFVDLCLSLSLISALSFQIPIFLIVLAAFKLVNSKQLLAIWRYVIIGAFTASAFLTPTPDPITMSLLALAILTLYFSTILLIKVLKIH